MTGRLILALLFIANYSIQAQVERVNLIILVNDQVATTITNAEIIIDSAYYNDEVTYWPGELQIDSSLYKLIYQIGSEVHLKFEYYSYKGKKQGLANFCCELPLNSLPESNPYLILEVFDFRDRRYRDWYSYLTDKNFLCELRFPW